MSCALDLCGQAILITRPRHQSENLRGSIEKAGGEAVVVPSIEIAEPSNPEKLGEITARLNDFDIAIFISANAATMGLGWLRDHCISWPDHLAVAAVGRATTAALEKQGIKVNIIPAGKYDSEGLLAHPALQNASGKKVIIFRGQGGREHLARTLNDRGAHVEYAEVYERHMPDINLSQQLNGEQRNKISVIVTTSNQGLENLVAMTDPDLRTWLFNTALIVLSERGAEKAKALGFHNTVAVTPQASDDAILGTIKRIIEH